MPSPKIMRCACQHVNIEGRGDTNFVQTFGVCVSPACRRAGGKDSIKNLTHLDHAVVVAMSTVRKMQMTVNQIVFMISVRNGLMSAGGAMPVLRVMGVARMVRSAASRIGSTDSQGVLIDVFVVDKMKVSIMKVILMVIVPDNGMATIGTVGVWVLVMSTMFVHGVSFLPCKRVISIEIP